MTRIRRLLLTLAAGVFTLAVLLLAAAGPASAGPPIGPGSHPPPKHCPILNPFCNAKSWWNYFDFPGTNSSANLPSLPNCKDAPSAQKPGRGLSGWIDPGPDTFDPAATSVYGQSQYPPQWATYDLGCGGTYKDPMSGADTMIGNWLKGAATVEVALCNSLHRVVSPPTFLNRLDPLIQQSSDALHTAVYDPFIDVSVILLGVGIVWASRRKQLPQAVEATAWALFVMVAATGLWSYPVKAGHLVDTVATSTIGSVNSAMLGEAPNAADPSASRAAMLTQSVLYLPWLQCEVGSTTSPVAVQYGRLLLASQTYSYAEAAQIKADPTKQAAIARRKAGEFQKIAQAIQAVDTDAYNHLKGQAGARSGCGAESLFAATATAPFMVIGDLLVVVALLILRFFVVFFPVLAVIGIHLRMRRMVTGAWGMVAGALVNAAVFGFLGALDALTVGFLLGSSGSGSGLPAWLAVVVCAIITVVLWHVAKPFRHLRSTVAPQQVARSAADGGEAVTSGARRFAGRTLAAVTGVELAGAVGGKHAAKPAAGAAAAGVVAPEAWTRAEPAAAAAVTLPDLEPVEPVEPGEPAEPVADADGVRRIYGEHTVTVEHRTPEPVTRGPRALPAPDDGLLEPPPPTAPAATGSGAVPLTGLEDTGDDDTPITVHDTTEPLIRADPVLTDGELVYRIYDPATDTTSTMSQEDERVA